MKALYITDDDVIEGDLIYIMGDEEMFVSFDTAWRHREPRFMLHFKSPVITKISSSITVVSDGVEYNFIPVADAGEYYEISRKWCKTQPFPDIDWSEVHISEDEWARAMEDVVVFEE